LYCTTSQRYTLYSLLQQIAPPSAGHIVGQQQLTSYLQKALSDGPRNVVLFLQDKMSIEDFTMYGGAFGNKQDTAFPNLEGALMSSSSPLVLPAVSWPASNAVIGQLQDHLDTSPLYMDPETLSQLRLNASSPALLVFRLPADLMSAKEILSGNDEVIGQVMSTMKTQAVPYTAIYTALRPARVRRTGSRMNTLFLPSVSLQEGEDTCILLWAKGLSVSILRSGRWEDHDLTPSTFGEAVSPKLHGSSCDKTKAKWVGPCGAFRDHIDTHQRHYKVSARRWFTLDSVQLEYDSIKAKFNASRSVYAPAEFSYRCQSVSSFRWPQLVPHAVNDPANHAALYSIQGFNVTGGDFSYASDCAGFFSPGIWMGLMTSLLMVLVLTYGLHMIMQLRTMDRFDDPKGPAISVPQTE
uniref:ATPase H+ transporting accessory protein 1a n=1 Tax=Cyclopterus lumpus TaxID=8103 RepID=A0A8C2XEA4_CYCLU